VYIVKPVWDYAKIKWLDEYMIGHKGFIAGGCFKNIFNGDKAKDIDVFFESEADFTQAKLMYEADENYYLYYENTKVIAFKNKKMPHVTIELIKTAYGTPEQILDIFDFTIVKFAYFKHKEESDPFGDPFGDETITEYKVMFHENFFEHLQLKRLVINEQLRFPVGTLERMFRYAKYGYFPCRESKRRLIVNLRENINPNDDISLSLYDGLD
jgi:hypothetical protein